MMEIMECSCYIFQNNQKYNINFILIASQFIKLTFFFSFKIKHYFSNKYNSNEINISFIKSCFQSYGENCRYSCSDHSYNKKM